MINKIKSKYGFREMPKALDEFVKVVDTTINDGKWEASKAAKLKNTMFTLGTVNYTQQDFADYVATHQSKHSAANPQGIVKSLYNEWINESCLSYEESKLDENYPDFRALMNEYRDGILLFELTDKKVWSKAVKDSAGLKEYYDANKNNYMWPDRLEATVYTCANADVAKNVRKLMKTIDDADTLMASVNKDNALNLQVKSGKFAKGENETIDAITWTPGVTKDIQKGSNIVFVEVKRVIPAQPKSLEEAKGLITADYQSHLEKEWIESLKKKYAVRIHQDVVESIIKN
jgi:peptidyl-prolyl cis-trans isomerase SurA